MKIAQGKRVKRAPPWVIKQNESKPRGAKENVDKTLEPLSSLTGLNPSRAVNPPLKTGGLFSCCPSGAKHVRPVRDIQSVSDEMVVQPFHNHPSDAEQSLESSSESC
jgi:hypothetical protein